MDNKKFRCHGPSCVNTCCGAYKGFSDRLYSVDNRLFSDIILTSKDVSRLTKSEFDRYVFLGEDGIYRIKTSVEGECSAYKHGQCSINENKPTICRCYPLYLDAFIGLCALRECPAVSDGYSLDNYCDQVKDLLDLYEFWIRYYKECLKVID